MVSKKKVNKKVSTSSGSNKKKVSRKTTPRITPRISINGGDNISSTNNNTNVPAVEQLNIAPPNMVQEKLQSTQQSAALVEEKSPEIKMIEPAAKYVNELSKPKSEIESKILKILGIGLCSLVVIFWLAVLMMSIQVHSGPKVVEENVTLITQVPVKFSFDEMINEQNGSSIISLQGYLRRKIIDTTPKGSTINSSREVFYILDDTGENITVMIKLSQRADYEKLFTNNSKVKTAYNITGVYSYKLPPIGEYILDISDIEPFTRKLVEESTTVMENVTIDDTTGVAINITRGWTRVSSII